MLDSGDDHHLRRVLRVRAGEFVSASDGAGAWRWCEMSADGELRPIDDVNNVTRPWPPITVAFALVKGDRPEWIVQKLTELGIDRERLEHWCQELGWETVLNRAGTTFRKLPETDRSDLNARKAVALMLAQPSMIKRPVLEQNGRLLVGFKPALYEAAVRVARQ